MSLINISHLSFAYPGSYDDVFCDVTLQIDTNWRLGLVGRNGRGKTTFLRLLCGEYPYQGRIDAGGTAFSYFPFKVEDESLSAREIVKELTGCVDWELEREASLLEICEDALDRPFDTLSGGERTKLLLSAMFLRDSEFLLIDEPTNHLDTDARTSVSRYLRTKRGFILVSHDRAFLDGFIMFTEETTMG